MALSNLSALSGRAPHPVFLIAGPTASGKSALALRIAKRLGGVIVNADSMQVYRDLAVITARPSREEMAQAPHHLFGHVDAVETYSVARWLSNAGGVLAEADRQGHPMIVVGGTGLYFKAALEGLSDIPPVPEMVRRAVREAAEGQEAATLHARLTARDPLTAARLRPGDRQRVLRALEVLEATGRPLASFQASRQPALLAGRVVRRIFLTRPRDELAARIAARFANMMAGGAMEEVAALAARRLDPTLPAMRAHGVPWLIRHQAGEIDRDTAVAGAVADTRRYAKRQETWFRGQLPDWEWLSAEDAWDALAAELDIGHSAVP